MTTAVKKAQEVKNNRMSGKRLWTNILIHVLLAILAFIWVMPIVWIVLTSFRAEPGSYVNTFFPKGYTLNNYIKLFTDIANLSSSFRCNRYRWLYSTIRCINL